MRRVRTASGAVAVQVVVKEHGEVVEVDHVGSAHTDAELALLLTAAADRLQPGQESLDLGPLPQPEVRLADVADWTDTRRDQIARRPKPAWEAEPRPRITRDVITAYTMLSQSIGARQSVRRARRRRP